MCKKQVLILYLLFWVRSVARCNKSFYAILGITSKTEVSGYDVRKILEKTSKAYWSESNAQIYPTLKLMQEKGLVVSRLDESSGARQCRKYSITEQGQEVLLEWLASPCDFPKYREETLLKLSLGQHQSIEQLIEHIKHYEKALDERIEHLHLIEDHINTAHADRPDKAFLLMTYHHVSMVLHAKKQWVRVTLTQLRHMGE